MKVVVTGASGDIGKAIVRAFSDNGHEVHGIDLVQWSEQIPAGYTHHIADVRGDLPPIEGVNIVVTAAGIQLPEEDTLAVNLVGTIRTVEQYALHEGIRAVVTIASASARTGSEFPLYAASKGGVVTYTKNLATRLAPYGATANSISPGGVYTASNAPVLDDPRLCAEAIGESLLHKWATPQEIGEWVYFLAAVNRSMTGEDLLIDNGESIKSHFVWPEQ